MKTLCSNEAWFICRAGQYFWNWTDKKVKTRDTRLFWNKLIVSDQDCRNPFSSSKELTCIEMAGNCFYLNHITSNIFLQNLSSWVRFEWAPCFANVKRIVQYSSTVQYLHPYNHMLNSQDWSLDLKKKHLSNCSLAEQKMNVMELKTLFNSKDSFTNIVNWCDYKSLDEIGLFVSFFVVWMLCGVTHYCIQFNELVLTLYLNLYYP